MLKIVNSRGARTVRNQTVVQGDCLKIMAGMQPRSVDVVVTSPPYNLDIAYGHYDDRRSEAEYLEWMGQIVSSVNRVLRVDGSFFLNVAGSGSRPWLPFEIITQLRSTFKLQNHISWVKSIGIGTTSTGHFKPISGRRYTHQNHEHIFHLSKHGDVVLDRLSIGVPFTDKSNIGRRNHSRDLRCRGNTWFIPYHTVRSRSKKFNHPSTFPIELPLWCIYIHGNPNAIVLDPFVGSGTSLIAAHYAGVTGVGIDIDANYIETAYDRLASAVGGSMDVHLDEGEIGELLKQPPETKDKGGFQSLLVRLQNKLNRSTGHLTLSDQDLEQISRYAFEYGNGGWENTLVTIFGRHLGPKLDRS